MEEQLNKENKDISKKRVRCPNINYGQCAKVFFMIFYLITAAFSVFLMGYGLETGMNEMSMFVVDMVIYIVANICHIGLWNVKITNADGTETIIADNFGYKYYLGGVVQNIVYIVFWFYFNNHFFLNSMTFIMICYNFMLYPLYNMCLCIWDQMSKIFYYDETNSVVEESNDGEKYYEINISEDSEDVPEPNIESEDEIYKEIEIKISD